jgi:hypothetical protein
LVHRVFFKKKEFYYSTWQSSSQQLGLILSIPIAAYLSSHFGLLGIVVFDVMTFVLYAAMMFLTKYEPFVEFDNHDTSSHNSRNDSTTNLSATGLTLLVFLYPCAVLFAQWDGISSVPLISELMQVTMQQAANLKSIISICILVVVLIFAARFQNTLLWLWGFAAGILPVAGALLFVSYDLFSVVFFSLGAFIICLDLPVQRLIISRYDATGEKSLAARLWIFQTLLGLTLLPLGLLLDNAAESSGEKVGICLLFITAIGLLTTSRLRFILKGYYDGP